MRLLLAILLISSVAAQDCVLLNELETPVSGETLLCPGVYELLEPIDLVAGASLDCQGSVINGSDDIAGFTMSGKDMSIKNCTIEGFKVAVRMSMASDSFITESVFVNNEFGLFLANSTNNTVTGSVFIDNAGALLFQDSKDNWIYGNDFYPTGLVDIFDTGNFYCKSGVGNAYHDEDGPRCQGEAPEEVLNATEPIINRTEVIIEQLPPLPDMAYSIPTPRTDEIRTFMAEVLGIEGYSGQDLARELRSVMKRVNETEGLVEIEKRIVISPERGTSTVITRIKVLKDVKDLYVYESIPKCIADDIAEIYFAREPDRILKPDPIVVWHFPNANAGDDLELSYEVQKEVNMMPQTIVITEEINLTDAASCLDSPMSVPIAEKLGIDMRLILPIVGIPVIIILYLYFNRFRKHFRKAN